MLDKSVIFVFVYPFVVLSPLIFWNNKELAVGKSAADIVYV